MDHWTDEKLCQLVTLYSQCNNLWDKDHPCHFKTHCRYQSYKKIQKSLSTPGVSVIHVLSKLWHLRNDYVAELRKVQLEKKRNSLYRPRKKWFYAMHQFLYDHLDENEKPSDDSCQSSSSSTSSLPRNDRCFQNKNQLITKLNNSEIERGMRFERSCVKFQNHCSQQGDEANLSKCCEDKVKDVGKGNSSKSGRKLQDSTCEQLFNKSDKFLSKGSKRGQCTSSSKSRHQDQEYRSSNLQTSKLWAPTSSESPRSTPKPTSWQKERFSCCSNCSCCSETTNWENSNIADKFRLLNSNNVLGKSKCGTGNQSDRVAKEYVCGCGESNVSSSDSLNNENDGFEKGNNLNNVRRVLCLDELSDHVTRALNEMFMKLCPVDIACFNSYCTNETCQDAEKDKVDNEERKSTTFENETEKDVSNIESKNSIVEVSNGKENRQSLESSQDKTTSVEDDNFSQLGTEVARVLKESNRAKALRLKAAIKQTLESAKEED